MLKANQQFKFLQYAEGVEAADMVLEEDTVYTVLKVVETNKEDRSVTIQIANPAFDPKKKASAKNPSELEVTLFDEEFEAIAAKPAAKTKAGAAAKGKAKEEPVDEADEDGDDGDEDGDEDDEDGDEGDDEGDEAEAAAPAKPKAKGKAEAKPAPKATTKPAAKDKAKEKAKTKGKDKVKAKAKDQDEDADPYADLENEDEDIVSLVEDHDDILGLASELVEEAAATDYRLGGVLFHIRKEKAYESLDKRYADKGGFELYVQEHLNIEYRKAMYLVKIYYTFNKFGISGDKVQELGWTKASKISEVMTEDNADELVSLAEDSTVSVLTENIKASYKEVGGTKGEKKRLTIFKFKVYEDKGDALKEILEATAAAHGYKKLDDAFEHIITEWAAEHPVTHGAKAKAKAKAKARDEADEADEPEEAAAKPARSTAKPEKTKPKATSRAR